MGGRLAALTISLLVAGSSAATAGASGPYVAIRIPEAPRADAAEPLREHRGSGVVIGTSTSGGWFVLTNAHVAAPESRVKLLPPRVYAAGGWREGKLLGFDRKADLALIVIRCPERLRVMPIAPAAPADGTQVVTRAFAAGVEYRSRTAELRRELPVEDGEAARAEHTYFLKTTFVAGESGGAVLSNGRLVGLIYGNDLKAGYGLCVDYPAVTAFLGRWGWRPSMYERGPRSIAAGETRPRIAGAP